MISFGKGAGAGYAPLAGIICREHVYEAIDAGSKNFEHGHLGRRAAPLRGRPAVLDVLERERSWSGWPSAGRASCEPPVGNRGVRRSRRGVVGAFCSASSSSTRATARRSCRPWSTAAPRRRDRARARPPHEFVPRSVDGFASDQTLLSPAFTSTDAELAEMLERLAGAVEEVDAQVKRNWADEPDRGLGARGRARRGRRRPGGVRPPRLPT